MFIRWWSFAFWHCLENWKLTWHYKWKPGHTLVVLHEDILTVSSLFFRSSNLHDHGQWPLVIVVMTMIIAMFSIIIPFFLLGCDSYSQHHHHHHRHMTKSPKSTMVPLSLGLEHRVERLHGGWIFTSAEVHSPFKNMFKAPVLIIIQINLILINMPGSTGSIYSSNGTRLGKLTKTLLWHWLLQNSQVWSFSLNFTAWKECKQLNIIAVLFFKALN